MNTMEKIHKETSNLIPKIFTLPFKLCTKEWPPCRKNLEVLADSRPSLRQSEGKTHPGLLKHQTGKEVITLLSSVLVCLHLEYCVHFWAPKREKVFGEDGKAPEGIQRKATKLMKGIEGVPCGEWPRTPGLSSLEKRRLRPPLCSPQLPEGGSAQRGAELFSQVSKDRTQGNTLKLCRGGLDWT